MGPITITFTAMAATLAQDKAPEAGTAPPPPRAVIVPPPAPPRVPERPAGPNLAPTPRIHPAIAIDRDDYPPAALRENRSGRTMVELAVTRWGTVADCKVVTSSGHADLDAASCDKLVGRVRFWPATDEKGKDTAGIYRKTIRWALPEELPPPVIVAAPPIASVPYPTETVTYPRGPLIRSWGWARIRDDDWPAGAREAGRKGTARIGFDMDATGAVTGCKVLASSGHADLDERSCAIARERLKIDPALGNDGRPSPSRGEQEFAWVIPSEFNSGTRQTARMPSAPPRQAILPAFMSRPGMLTVTMMLGEDGKATECRLGAQGGMEGAKVLADSFCKDAREKGFRSLDPGKAPLPREIELKLDLKTVTRGR